uniref:Uncharacterized protein n=1 Tax=Strongyloides venezuelensis TaxID=75913 RepID=A0A0K0FRJ8_STRVS
MLKEEIEKLKMRNKNLSENMELKEEMNLNLNFQLTEAKETIKEMEEAENFANSKKNQLPICLKEEIEKIEIYKITEDLEEKEDVIVKADGIVDGADFIVNEADVISDEDNVIVDEAEFEFDDIDICLQPQFTSSRKSAAFEENMEYYWMIHFSKNKASFILKENGRILRKDKIEPVTNVSKQLLELLILEKIFKLKINFIFNYSVTIVSNNHLEAIYGEDFATEYKNCLPLAKHVHSMLTKFISINIEVVSDDYVTKLFNDCLKIENG